MPQVQVIQPIQQQPKRLRVAAYARVSSDSEDQLNSLAVQVDYYTHLIQENPNWEFAGIYTDEGITGTSTKRREQFNRLMDDCRAGLIDRVLHCSFGLWIISGCCWIWYNLSTICCAMFSGCIGFDHIPHCRQVHCWVLGR